MAEARTKGGELFIVDNSDSDWKVRNYLHEWSDIASRFDIATGYFEIGALLALDGKWQQLENIRILMGDEVSRRTKNAFLEGLEHLKKILDDSIEAEKDSNLFLTGLIDDILKGLLIPQHLPGKFKCELHLNGIAFLFDQLCRHSNVS